jgi:hypothetical protein
VTKTVAEVFDELKASLESNMRHILRIDVINPSQAGHLPAAILVVVGSEALSRLQDEREDHVFVEMMVRRHLERFVARDLFKALRNGLAHLWGTNFLQIESDPPLQLVVSWQKTGADHLTWHQGAHLRLHLNVHEVWNDLQAARAAFASVLQSDRDRAGSGPPESKWDNTWHVDRGHVAAWRRYLSQARAKDSG